MRSVKNWELSFVFMIYYSSQSSGNAIRNRRISVLLPSHRSGRNKRTGPGKFKTRNAKTQRILQVG